MVERIHSHHGLKVKEKKKKGMGSPKLFKGKSPVPPRPPTLQAPPLTGSASSRQGDAGTTPSTHEARGATPIPTIAHGDPIQGGCEGELGSREVCMWPRHRQLLGGQDALSSPVGRNVNLQTWFLQPIHSTSIH